MLFIPGQLIALLTFPGVIVHEFAHQLFCRLQRVAILQVCYFQFANPAGYVIHEKPKFASQSLWIGIGPFIINTIIGALIGAPGIAHQQLGSSDFLDIILIWLGVSIAMHAFPSTGDAQSIWKSIMNEQTSILLRIITVPIVGLIYLGALGSFFWLDAIYGYGVVWVLPKLLANLIA